MDENVHEIKFEVVLLGCANDLDKNGPGVEDGNKEDSEGKV